MVEIDSAEVPVEWIYIGTDEAVSAGLENTEGMVVREEARKMIRWLSEGLDGLPPFPEPVILHWRSAEALFFVLAQPIEAAVSTLHGYEFCGLVLFQHNNRNLGNPFLLIEEQRLFQQLLRQFRQPGKNAPESAHALSLQLGIAPMSGSSAPVVNEDGNTNPSEPMRNQAFPYQGIFQGLDQESACKIVDALMMWPAHEILPTFALGWPDATNLPAETFEVILQAAGEVVISWEEVRNRVVILRDQWENLILSLPERERTHHLDKAYNASEDLENALSASSDLTLVDRCFKIAEDLQSYTSEKKLEGEAARDVLALQKEYLRLGSMLRQLLSPAEPFSLEGTQNAPPTEGRSQLVAEPASEPAPALEPAISSSRSSEESGGNLSLASHPIKQPDDIEEIGRKEAHEAKSPSPSAAIVTQPDGEKRLKVTLAGSQEKHFFLDSWIEKRQISVRVAVICALISLLINLVLGGLLVWRWNGPHKAKPPVQTEKK
jgi:hypothetical protein